MIMEMATPEQVDELMRRATAAHQMPRRESFEGLSKALAAHLLLTWAVPNPWLCGECGESVGEGSMCSESGVPHMRDTDELRDLD